MSAKKSYGAGIGTSSILVIIVILCLVCFAGLSIVSATADYKLSNKLAERTTSYYEASSLANEKLAEINRSFLIFFRESNSKEEYLQKIKESYADSLTFSYPVSDTQALFVTIEPLYPETESGDLFEVTCFQVLTTEEIELTNTLPVFLGD